MTRFIQISDSHISAEELGYHQQPRYTEKIPALMKALDVWIQTHDIDFVLHSGDIVDQVSERSIQTARAMLSLSIPVYACLGNHDMTDVNAQEMWLDGAPEFFPDGSLEFSIACPSAVICVIPNHWNDDLYYWNWHELSPHFTVNQLNFWHEVIEASAGKDLILCTHNQTAAVPTSQTGFDLPYHAPPISFVHSITMLVQQTPTLRCVLSGHNHINTNRTLNTESTRAVTVSAFSETPFEFKVFDLQPGRLMMRTENIVHQCGFESQYNYDKVFVQGRLKDRVFDLTW